jgi:large subunit ribosomal protein L10
MPITKQKKREIIKELADKLDRQKSAVFADFSGLKVKDLTDLKNKLRQKGAEFKVAKKTLMNLALKQKGIDADTKTMAGEIAVAMGYDDEVSAAKELYQFSKTNQNIKILGGLLENKLIDAAQVLSLAQLPSKLELLARLTGSLAAPSRNFAGVLQGNLRGLVQVLSQIQKSKA